MFCSKGVLMCDGVKKNHDDKFKAKVALAMIKGNKPVDDLCHEFNISTSQAYAWKQQLEEHSYEIFLDKRKIKKEPTYEKLFAELEQVREECNFLERVLSR